MHSIVGLYVADYISRTDIDVADGLVVGDVAVSGVHVAVDVRGLPVAVSPIEAALVPCAVFPYPIEIFEHQILQHCLSPT